MKRKKQALKQKKINLREYKIEYCKACYSTTNTQSHYKCTCYPEGTPLADDMTNKLYDMVTWTDVIVFASPINNFKISSLMALFIDRLISMDGSLKPADPQNKKDKETNIAHTKFIEDNATEKFGSGFLKRFTGKIGGIIVCGHEAGASLTISNLFLTLNHYGMLFPPYNNIYAMNTVLESTDKDKKNVNNKEFELEARLLAKNLITAAKIAKRKDDYWWVYDGRAD